MEPVVVQLLTSTQFSIELAKALNGEIINGDSMQVYQGLDNITNKHPVEERENIPHHLLGHIPWNEEYSVQQFEKEALRVIDDIHSRGKLPILVGGTHYYNQAVIFKNSTLTSTESPVAHGLDEHNVTEGTEGKEQKELTKEQLEILDGPTSIVLQHLKEHDPLVAQKFHPNDNRRIRRALEIFYTTGVKPSSIYLNQKNTSTDGIAQNKDDSTGEDGSKLDARFRTLVFWIWSEQQNLNERLDDRVDAMVKNGLNDEIDQMFDVYSKLKSVNTGDSNDNVDSKGVWQVIGFRQFLPWLYGGKTDAKVFESSVDEMKRNTRKYSKQQTKFMKNTLMPKINAIISANKKVQPGKIEHQGIVATILNATDLSQWKTEVGSKGIKIAEEFVQNKIDNMVLIDGKEVLFDAELEPSKDANATESASVLQQLLITPKKFDETQWENFTCDICSRNTQISTTGPNSGTATINEPYIAVGKKNWELHLKSRKHKNMQQKLAKMKRNKIEIEKKRAYRNEEEDVSSLDDTPETKRQVISS